MTKVNYSAMAVKAHRRAFLLWCLREFESQQELLAPYYEETESEKRLRQALHNALARLDRTGA